MSHTVLETLHLKRLLNLLADFWWSTEPIFEREEADLRPVANNNPFAHVVSMLC